MDDRLRASLNVALGAVALGVVGFVAVQSLRLRGIEEPAAIPQLQSIYQTSGRAALLAEQKGDFAQARREWEAALAARPHSPSVLRRLGLLALRAGERRKAFGIYRKLTENDLRTGRLSLDNSDNLAWYGDLCGEFGKAEDADPSYRLATSQRWTTVVPEDASVAAMAHWIGSNSGYGVSRLGVGNPIERENTIGHLRRAVELAPTSLNILMSLAESVEGEESVRLLRRARPLIDPHDTRMVLRWADAQSRVDRKSEARAMIGVARRRVSARDTAENLQIAESLFRAGDIEGAKSLAFETASGINPRQSNTYDWAARTVFRMGGAPELILLLDKAKPLVGPHETQAYSDLALLTALAGKETQAKAMLNEALAVAPEGLKSGIRTRLDRIDLGDGGMRGGSGL